MSSTRTTLIALLAVFGITALYYSSTTNTNNHPTNMSATPSNLAITLSQPRTNPPTLTITLTNTHPSTPLTLLTWDSPLDPQALALGLVAITPLGADTSGSAAAPPLELPTAKVSRKLPPPRDALVTLGPGESSSRDVVLREPVVPLGAIREKGGKVRVAVKGSWKSVWAKNGEEVSDEEVEAMGGGEGVMTGEFESEGLEVEV